MTPDLLSYEREGAGEERGRRKEMRLKKRKEKKLSLGGDSSISVSNHGLEQCNGVYYSSGNVSSHGRKQCHGVRYTYIYL